MPASRSTRRARRGLHRRTCRSAVRMPSPPRVTTTLTMPRRVTVAAGCPTAALPVSQTRMVSARSSSGWLATNASRPPVPCSSEPSTTSFRFTGTSSPSARNASRCGDDVALAVGGAASVPAAVDLGEFEGRRAPCGIVERRLHVVVRVEQHGRRIRIGSRPRADHRVGLPSGVSLEMGIVKIRAQRTCRAPTAPPWRTPRGGTAAGPPPTGWRRARPAPPVPDASDRRCGRAGPSAHAPPVLVRS